MIYLAIISFVVFLVYSVISIAENKEIPDNLSDTYYLYPKWVFPMVMVFMSFTLLPCWLEITEGETGQFLSFLSCAGLLFVASAPDYKNDKGQYNIHAVCAYLAVATSLISLICVGTHWWLVPQWLICMFGFNFMIVKTKYIWLIETAIIGATYMNVILSL